MKKLSGIRYGQRVKQRAQNDIEKIIKLKRHLITKYKLEPKREWYLGFDELGHLDFIREWIDQQTAEEYQLRLRCPDLMFLHPKKGLVIIELDGAVHDRKVEKTSRRNEQYRNAGIKLIILNEQEIKFNKERLLDVLDWKMTKLGL